MLCVAGDVSKQNDSLDNLMASVCMSVTAENEQGESKQNPQKILRWHWLRRVNLLTQESQFPKPSKWRSKSLVSRKKTSDEFQAKKRLLYYLFSSLFFADLLLTKRLNYCINFIANTTFWLECQVEFLDWSCPFFRLLEQHENANEKQIARPLCC